MFALSYIRLSLFVLICLVAGHQRWMLADQSLLSLLVWVVYGV
jgi:hypothetical protein